VEHQFGAWQLTCDEIVRLARKFCSLRGVARAVDGTIVASLAVSTDDRGQPAALVTLPFGMALPNGVTVTRWDGSAKRKPVSAGLQPALCGGTGCQVVWPLRVDDIRAMSAGGKLQIAFRMKPAAVAAKLLTFEIPTVPIEGTVMNDGFSDALQASLH
ncbi:MAG: invasion associated locus B family protein, partial [Parafilimonas terrae]|nr:invasion associated locus B family protein [Parafilimonas terrae]